VRAPATSITQRELLHANGFDSIAKLARALNDFECFCKPAEPFEWNFTRDDLAELMDRLAAHEPALRLTGLIRQPALSPSDERGR
jgi:hypothetical protein